MLRLAPSRESRTAAAGVAGLAQSADRAKARAHPLGTTRAAQHSSFLRIARRILRHWLRSSTGREPLLPGPNARFRRGRALRNFPPVALRVRPPCKERPRQRRRLHSQPCFVRLKMKADGQVAQMVERGPEKAGVGGSSPSLATTPVSSWHRHLPHLSLRMRKSLRSAAAADTFMPPCTCTGAASPGSDCTAPWSFPPRLRRDSFGPNRNPSPQPRATQPAIPFFPCSPAGHEPFL